MSLLELAVIIVIAVIFIGPNEWPVIVKFIGHLFKKIKNIQKEINLFIDQIISTTDEATTKIRGDDGKFYDAYKFPTQEDFNQVKKNNEHKDRP